LSVPTQPLFSEILYLCLSVVYLPAKNLPPLLFVVQPNYFVESFPPCPDPFFPRLKSSPPPKLPFQMEECQSFFHAFYQVPFHCPNPLLLHCPFFFKVPSSLNVEARLFFSTYLPRVFFALCPNSFPFSADFLFCLVPRFDAVALPPIKFFYFSFPLFFMGTPPS